MLLYNWNMKSMTCCGECEIKKKKKKEWVQCFFTIGILNQWLVVESVKSITSFYCPAVPELYGSLICAFWLLTWKFCLLDDVLLVNSVLCMIADHDLVFGRCRTKEPHSWFVVFGRCRNKEPHSSGILLCRVVVVGYEKYTRVWSYQLISDLRDVYFFEYACNGRVWKQFRCLRFLRRPAGLPRDKLPYFFG